MRNIFSFLCLVSSLYLVSNLNTGCAQISAPTGGATDSLPPKLVKANPEQNTLNFTGKKVSLSFNEYIDLAEIQGNVLISPAQKNLPTITYNLKSISVKFKDSLLPNTTYSIDFGNAIKDVHEGNVLKNFTYVFSTGNTIDSLRLSGNVILAETGKADSTIMVSLYRNTADTAVLKTKPDYQARVDGTGHFEFKYLPAYDFNIFALKDGDGSKTYNSKTELFAFTDLPVNAAISNAPINLFAYAEEKFDNSKPAPSLKKITEKKLKITSNLTSQQQDLLEPLEISFNNPLKLIDSSKLLLTDTNYRPVPNYHLAVDSSATKITFRTVWQPEFDYVLLVPKDAIEDSSGNFLPKSDTIRFRTKKEADYGTIVIRFSNIELQNHPVIQFVMGEEIKFSFPIKSTEWSNKRIPPAEYSIRILYDNNNNGVWDPGNYTEKKQPEKVTNLSQKLAIKAGWDNERDIKL